METPTCPNCKGRQLYKAKQPVGSGGGYSPDFLPGLGISFWSFGAKFDVVVCQDCGLTRFVAAQESLHKLSTSPKWVPAS
jgi:DNA-directed RNA polymerase subunit RPC12/RpoP